MSSNYNTHMNKFDIENHTIVRIIMVTAAVLFVLYLASLVQRELIWIGTAFFLAVALNPAVEFFARKLPRKSRALATLIVFTLFVLFIGVLAATLGRPLVEQSE